MKVVRYLSQSGEVQCVSLSIIVRYLKRAMFSILYTKVNGFVNHGAYK
ncbi:MAG: hypothetical protein H0Z30_01255 [Candidatus Marinimicrobia bacterium]|nr:hypothetical protein [Candidatus Neomarinimicrobiota bacterium]